MRLLKVGRDAKCDITLSSPKVSSLHAEITLLDNGDIFLEDKNSLNGTFIMNQAIKANKPVKIRRGDAIRFADTELQWALIPMPEDISAYKGIFGIGTHFNNSIQLTGATVSRYHATVKLAKDGKMYIVDHSMNGTTVDGKKITPNNPYRIKRKSSVVCGGVPADLSSLPWPTEIWKYIGGIVACIAVLVAIGFGVHKLINADNGKAEEAPIAKIWSAAEINSRYESSLVLLVGAYHYEVTAGSLDEKVFKALGLPTKVLFYNGDVYDYEALTTREKMKYGGYYTGTGFFISEDGYILTNLHVVKPWLKQEDNIKALEEYYKLKFAKISELGAPVLYKFGLNGLSAYISQIEIKGVLDGIYLMPQGRIVSVENATYCTVRSSGDDLEKDVALIQSDKQELPTRSTTFVNVKDSMDISDAALTVGNKMFTVGFPYGLSLYDESAEKGIQAFCHAGNITSAGGNCYFYFDAVATGGASGSPIFNDQGMLIGILNAGVGSKDINCGIKAKYIRELLDNPHNKGNK